MKTPSTSIRRFLRGDDGATAVEYVSLLTLAVATVQAVMAILGGGLNQQATRTAALNPPATMTPAALNPETGRQDQITIKGENKAGEKGRRVLREILQAAGLRRAVVTRGLTTPADQARIMYSNIAARGVTHQKRLYGPPGQKVIDVYAANRSKPRGEVIELMRKKIVELGPSTVTHHMSTDRDVFDVAPSSIKNRKAFEKAVLNHPDVDKDRFLVPPADTSYHIEVPK
jgi:Flp pilus assembly pilin Flp